MEITDKISTKRLKLELINNSHIDNVYKLYSSEKVCKFFDIEPFINQEQAIEHVRRWLELFESKTQIRYAILKDDIFIGTCGLYLINNRHQRACLGYDLDPDFWGNGYAYEAVEAMINKSQITFNLHRIQAEVMQNNIESINLLEKMGFQKEGLLKQYEKWGEKGFIDLLMFSKIYSTTN
jgi:[ribosomal protein S5]-alanine N-acetyltransferase